MGLPERTNKTHREKRRKKKKLYQFSPVFQLQPCMVSPLPISQSPTCLFLGGCHGTAGEHLLYFSSVIVTLSKTHAWTHLYRKGSLYISVTLASQNSQQCVCRGQSLLTRSPGRIIPSINLSASIIKPHGLHTYTQTHHCCTAVS